MPKVVAKPLSLTVRPARVAHLAFEVGGVLGHPIAELGTEVSAFDFEQLFASFRAANTSEAVDPGGLPFDADGIDARTVKPSPGGDPAPALAALRAEPARTALTRAIALRKNAVITKYGKKSEIASFLRPVFTTRTARLTRLQRRSQQRTDKLLAAYSRSARSETDVVTTTLTNLVAKRHEEPLQTKTTVFSEKITNSETKHSALVQASKVKGNDLAGVVEVQTIENVGYDFRMPFIEEDMRNDRDQLSFLDQFVSHFMQSHYGDRLEETYTNELAALDADINQLQVAYLNTILLSPIPGTVTGVYKNPGEVVAAGEAVIRIEDNSAVLIVALIRCRGPIVIGAVLEVTTRLFDGADPPVTIAADIVAARGAGENDQWEVIAKASNQDAAGTSPLFPLGYTFDYDITQVAVLGPGEI